MTFQQRAVLCNYKTGWSSTEENNTGFNREMKSKSKQHSGYRSSKKKEEDRRRRRQRSYKWRTEGGRRRSAALQSLISLLARAWAMWLGPVPLWAWRKWATYESHYRNWLNNDTCLSATRLGCAALHTAHRRHTTTACVCLCMCVSGNYEQSPCAFMH